MFFVLDARVRIFCICNFVCFFFLRVFFALCSDAETGRVLSEFGRGHYIRRGVPRDRKAGEPERMLQRSVQRHLESWRVVRGE